jgi:hypothetical protein
LRFFSQIFAGLFFLAHPRLQPAGRSKPRRGVLQTFEHEIFLDREFAAYELIANPRSRELPRDREIPGKKNFAGLKGDQTVSGIVRNKVK